MLVPPLCHSSSAFGFAYPFTTAAISTIPAVATISSVPTITALAAISAIESITALAPVATVAALALAAAPHDGRRAFLEFLDANGHETQHILVDAHRAFHFVHGRRRGVDVEHDVMALAVFAHTIGQALETPIFALGDAAAPLGKGFGKLVGQGFDLGGRHILTDDENVLVERHPEFLLSDVSARRG
jgi:hypothetical protein